VAHLSPLHPTRHPDLPRTGAVSQMVPDCAAPRRPIVAGSMTRTIIATGMRQTLSMRPTVYPALQDLLFLEVESALHGLQRGIADLTLPPHADGLLALDP
jgi:hypothetical protein